MSDWNRNDAEDGFHARTNPLSRLPVKLVAIAAVAMHLVCGAGGALGQSNVSITNEHELAAVLKRASVADHVKLEEIGKSVLGRSLWAVNIAALPGDAEIAERAADGGRRCVVLLFGQQHGNEAAGAEALIELVDHLASDPSALSPNVDLWIVPRVNPDGAAADRRSNDAGADLNRDHVVLSQPETQALHALVRRIQPHLSLDCHEFQRDSDDYAERGWTEWPLIMMDTANLAIMPESLYNYGVGLCAAAATDLQADGFRYHRYFVGDRPGTDSIGELRYSTLEADDARNAISAHGCVSLIIESGIFRKAKDPQANLGRRVAAYRCLLEPFVNDSQLLAEIRETALASRDEPMPPLIPTNVMWANLKPTLTEVRVIETATGQTLSIPTSTFMHDRVIKSAVPTALGYAIEAKSADAFETMLKAHGLWFERLRQDTAAIVETVRLLDLQQDSDAIHHRYAGRQLTSPDAPVERTLEKGTLLVTVSEQSPLDARRTAILLEPRQLYGLYQWPVFRDLVDLDGTLPVMRILSMDRTSSKSPSP